MFGNLNKPLFILEMANNHMGDIEHGKMIIRQFSEVIKKYKKQFDFAFKLQLRDFSIIHPEYALRNDIKMVKRLNETKLTTQEFQQLKDTIEENGFISMCTPFDELSVYKVQQMGFQILKIASCSCADWPLMEEISKTDRPIIFSTGGAVSEDIDAMVSFFEHRKKSFGLMHCIGAYPTSGNQLQLNQIDLFKNRYPNIAVGFSTHEEPDNYQAVKMAVAKGCTIFERHVGIATDKYEINGYSSSPEQIDLWLESAVEAYAMCGISGGRMEFGQNEMADLNALYRGVYAKRDILKGEVVTDENIFYAMPIADGQLASRKLSKYRTFIANQEIKQNGAIFERQLEVTNTREKVSAILKKMSSMLKENNIVPPDKVEMAISAHYGIEKFDEYGAILIDVLNREYCKKLLVMFPGQQHPLHFHKIKEETFHILSGDFVVMLDGEEKALKKGDILTILREQKHSFFSATGAIVEEISTTHMGSDSYYSDDTIVRNKNRKISLTYWADFIDL